MRDEHSQDFSNFKEQLSSELRLIFPIPNDMFVLDCDASNHTIAAELTQVQNGKEETIAYTNHVLLPIRCKYCTTRKQLLVVVKFTRHFRYYLLGRRFTIRTDHNGLIWLTSCYIDLVLNIRMPTPFSESLILSPCAISKNLESM